MNKLLLLIFFSTILFAQMVYSQSQSISYSYDCAGNRIMRKVINLSSNPSSVKKQAEPEPVEEVLGEHKINVYPNPTKGMLAVEIAGFSEKEEILILVFDSQGKQLVRKKAIVGRNPLNMISYQSGMYVLRVETAAKMTEFKIVKQ